jgi:hypothetical protein
VLYRARLRLAPHDAELPDSSGDTVPRFGLGFELFRTEPASVAVASRAIARRR